MQIGTGNYKLLSAILLLHSIEVIQELALCFHLRLIIKKYSIFIVKKYTKYLVFVDYVGLIPLIWGYWALYH